MILILKARMAVMMPLALAETVGMSQNRGRVLLQDRTGC